MKIKEKKHKTKQKTHQIPGHWTTCNQSNKPRIPVHGTVYDKEQRKKSNLLSPTKYGNDRLDIGELLALTCSALIWLPNDFPVHFIN
jgi:hypothetical protein